MAFNGSGTYVLPGAALVDGQTISATEHNTLRDDVATALSTCVTRDGQSPATANLPMGNFKHTGLGSGTARTESINFGQVQDGKTNWVDGGGTADAITATYSPAITALVDGQICFVRATAANATTTPTFAPNGLTARTIVMQGGVALVAGSIGGDGHELILRYDLANTRWELLNPKPAEKAALAGSASQNFATNALTASGGVQSISASALIGYGTGAGGTVTQTTSKSTGVTLNKPCGRITTTNDALAAGATARFNLNNSTFTSGCTLYPMLASAGGIGGVYNCWLDGSANGIVTIALKNVSGSSYSDAVVIDFTISSGVSA